MASPFIIRFLLLLSSLLLACGVSLPIMEVEPHLGPYHEYLSYFMKELGEVQAFSIFNGILHLFWDGQLILGLVVFSFSVIFPIWKISCMWLGFNSLVEGDQPGRWFYLAEKLGKYSMVDVFVIALLIVAIKGLPGGSKVSLMSGLYCFVFSVLAVMVASWLIDRYWVSHRESSPPH